MTPLQFRLPASRAVWPLRWRELCEERAAIREYDGGTERAEAERLAERDVREECDRETRAVTVRRNG